MKFEGSEFYSEFNDDTGALEHYERISEPVCSGGGVTFMEFAKGLAICLVAMFIAGKMMETSKAPTTSIRYTIPFWETPFGIFLMAAGAVAGGIIALIIVIRQVRKALRQKEAYWAFRLCRWLARLAVAAFTWGGKLAHSLQISRQSSPIMPGSLPITAHSPLVTSHSQVPELHGEDTSEDILLKEIQKLLLNIESLPITSQSHIEKINLN